MATGARSYQWSTAGLTITACQAPRRISCPKTSRQSHEQLRETRAVSITILFVLVPIGAIIAWWLSQQRLSQALAGSRRDRRLPGHGRIVLACRDDRIGCISRRRQLVVCALHQRLFHANAGGGLGANARAEGAVVQHGCADLEQCRAAIHTGCGTQGTDGRRRIRPDCRRPLRLDIPGRAALCVATAERRRLLLGCQPSQRLLLSAS